MKQKNTKNNREPEWVDVHDEALMVSLGIRNPNLTPRDETIWTKTSKEKAKVRAAKRAHSKGDSHFHFYTRKSIPVTAKLIIHLIKNNLFEKTTYSMLCAQHNIGNILNRFVKVGKNGVVESLVSKYVYNGITYSPHERPFWYGNN